MFLVGVESGPSLSEEAPSYGTVLPDLFGITQRSPWGRLPMLAHRFLARGPVLACPPLAMMGETAARFN